MEKKKLDEMRLEAQDAAHDFNGGYDVIELIDAYEKLQATLLELGIELVE